MKINCRYWLIWKPTPLITMIININIYWILFETRRNARGKPWKSETMAGILIQNFTQSGFQLTVLPFKACTLSNYTSRNINFLKKRNLKYKFNRLSKWSCLVDKCSLFLMSLPGMIGFRNWVKMTFKLSSIGQCTSLTGKLHATRHYSQGTTCTWLSCSVNWNTP